MPLEEWELESCLDRCCCVPTNKLLACPFWSRSPYIPLIESCQSPRLVALTRIVGFVGRAVHRGFAAMHQ